MGTIERLSDEEVKKLNFTTSSTSSSTPLRVLRDSTSKVPNTGGIFSVISQVAAGIDIGDGLTCIINHCIGQYAASLDIRKAYRQIRVSNKDAMLRLSIWYDDPMKKQGLVVFKTNMADFGDSQASLALRVAQDKYIAAHCKTPLAILASNWPFADNYMMSGKNKQQVLDLFLNYWIYMNNMGCLSNLHPTTLVMYRIN